VLFRSPDFRRWRRPAFGTSWVLWIALLAWLRHVYPPLGWLGLVGLTAYCALYPWVWLLALRWILPAGGEAGPPARLLAMLGLAGAGGDRRSVAGGGGDCLAGPARSEGGGGGSGRRNGAASLFADMLQSLDPEQMGGMVKKGLRTQLEKLDISPLLGKLLGSAIADKRHMPLLDAMLRWTGITLEANEDLLRKLIHDRANGILRWTGLDESRANAILDGLFKLIAECVVVPDHPVRLKVEEGLESLADKLANDPEMQDRVARLKLELLANPAMAAWMDSMWERTRLALLSAARDPDRALSGQFGQSLAELGAALKRDPKLQHLVNRFVRRTAVGIASRYGDQIVRLVSETVKRWDASTVTTRIEGAVGRDLQFIRINGTIVGGLVGVAIHCINMVMP